MLLRGLLSALALLVPPVDCWLGQHSFCVIEGRRGCWGRGEAAGWPYGGTGPHGARTECSDFMKSLGPRPRGETAVLAASAQTPVGPVYGH